MGALCVTGDEFFDRVATEWPTANARKHALTLCRQILSQPGLQHRGRVVAERRAPLFPSLPLAPDVCATPQDDILAPETDQFRDAQTRLDRDGQEGRRPIHVDRSGVARTAVISAPSRNAMGLRWSRLLGIARTCWHSKACAGSVNATYRKNE